MGKSRVTIRDIAREAGVSHATVSRALNNHREINIETRKRIHELARQMNYIPDGIARGLVTNRSNCVGMIIPDMDNQFVDRVVDGAEDYLNGNGRCMILAQSRYQEGKELNLVKTMLEQRVEGLIVSPLSVDNLTKIKELCQDIPLVFVCADTSEYGERCVASDDYSIGRCVAEYLLSLGHREILYMGGDEKNQGICRRVQGFRKVLEEQGYTCLLYTSVNWLGSLGSVFFTQEDVVNYESAKSSDTSAFAEYFKYMLSRGIHLAPSQFEAMFLSAAHGEEDLRRTLDAVESYVVRFAQTKRL